MTVTNTCPAIKCHSQLKAGVYVGSEISSGDLFKSAVSKPGQDWDEDVVKEPAKLAEYAANYHHQISRSETGKGFQNPSGPHFFLTLC